jgi:hypothetical protein
VRVWRRGAELSKKIHIRQVDGAEMAEVIREFKDRPNACATIPCRRLLVRVNTN